MKAVWQIKYVLNPLQCLMHGEGLMRGQRSKQLVIIN